MKLLYAIVRTLNILAVVAVVLIGIGAWLLGSERGSAALARFAENRVVPGLSLEGVRGTVLGGLSLDRLRLDLDGGQSLDARDLAVSFDALSLLTAALVVERVVVREAQFIAPAGGVAIELPVAVVVQQGHVSRFRLVAGERETVLTDTRFSLRLVEGRLEVDRAGSGAAAFETLGAGAVRRARGDDARHDGPRLRVDLTAVDPAVCVPGSLDARCGEHNHLPVPA